jgi:hypothetical protein
LWQAIEKSVAVINGASKKAAMHRLAAYNFGSQLRAGDSATPATIAAVFMISRNSRDLDLLLQMKPQVAVLLYDRG